MQNTAIVPKKKIRDLNSDELLQLTEAVSEVANVYEEVNPVLARLDDECYRLADVGAVYNELTDSVRLRIANIRANGILGKIE